MDEQAVSIGGRHIYLGVTKNHPKYFFGAVFALVFQL